jgi:hypothetical protein
LPSTGATLAIAAAAGHPHLSGIPSNEAAMESFHATTIPSVREGDRVVPGGDGQVTLGNTVVRATQKIVRPAPVYQARFSDTSR